MPAVPQVGTAQAQRRNGLHPSLTLPDAGQQVWGMRAGKAVPGRPEVQLTRPSSLERPKAPGHGAPEPPT